MKKRLLAVLLCLSMVASMLPLGVVAQGTEEILLPEETAPIIAEDMVSAEESAPIANAACTHTDWSVWESGNSLPTTSGNYCLSKKVELTDTWSVADGQTINLCLGGFEITQTTFGKRVISVTKGTLNIYDCTKTGKITGAKITANGGAIIANGSSVNVSLNNITFSGNQAQHGGAIAVHGGAKVTLTGVSVSGNTATGQGGGIYVVDSGSKLTLNNVTVTGNTTTSTSDRAAGGVHVNANNSTTLKGKVIIDENYKGTGASKVRSNLEVDHNRLVIDNALTTDSKIGLSVFPLDYTQVVSLVSKAAVSCYYADDDSKIPEVKGDVLHLVEKPVVIAPHANTEGYTKCGHGSATWTQWSSTDAMPTQSGTYFLGADVKLSDSWTLGEGVEITLCLNGFDIIHTGSKQVIVMNGGKLNICDCTAKTESGVYTAGRITGANTSERGAGLNIQGNSEFNFYDGRITGNTSSSYGGGIYAHTCKINIFGGEISANHADSQAGGGICINGNVTLNITGGTIKNNTAKIAGALTVQGAGNAALLKDCTITGNTATSMGGGIYVGKPDSVTLSGKLNITGNTVGSSKSNLFVVSTASEARPVIQKDLDAASTIGIGIYNTTVSNVLVKSGATQNTKKCYIPDDNTKYIQYKDGQLLLVNEPVEEEVVHANTDGYTACGHGSATWTEWAATDSLPTANGTYFLTADVALSDVWKLSDGQEITLCLNGFDITQTTAGKRIAELTNGTLNICDCTESGKLTGADVTVNGGAMIANGSSVQVNVYDITFSGNKANHGGAISVHGGAKVVLTGVTVTDNTAAGQGGGIYVVDSGSKLTLDNVTVTGNTTLSTSDRAAGGVHVNANNSTTLKGKVIIDENYKGTGASKVRSNLEVDHNRLVIDNALTTDSKIGLSVYPLDYTQVVSLVSKAAVDCYYSDDPAKIPEVKGDILHLVVKPVASPEHADTEGYTPCGHGNVTWTAWEETASLPAVSGNYFLADDVKLTDVWKLSGGQTITICLNGFDITQTTAGKRIIEVTNGTLNLCDCTKSGKLSGANVTVNGGAMIANGSGAKVNLYDITLTGNKANHGGAVSIHGGAAVTLNDVTVTGNTAAGQGGGVYVSDSGSKLLLNNVTVTGNTTTSTSTRAAGGVHVNAINSTTLNGKVIIDGNFRGTGANKVAANLEVDHDRLAIDDALTTDSKIGLSVYPEDYTKVIQLKSKAAVDCYYSDDPAKIPEVQGDILHLVVKPTVIPVHADTEGYTACDHDKLTWTGWDKTDSLPTQSGNYFLGADVELSKVWNAGDGKEITICLNGYSITQKTEGLRVIRVGTSTVNICDCTAHTDNGGNYIAGKITGGNTDDSDAAGNAGAMLLTGEGTFRLYDGNITDNHTKGNGVIVAQKGFTFEMHGGAITHNSAGKQGGAVYASRATVKLTDGIITGNEAVGSGGAMYVYGGTFTMEGGLISENESINGGGGGIAFKNASNTEKAIVTISGGEISKNLSKLDGSGIRMDSGVFKMSGGKVTENGSESAAAGGLRLGGGEATISGGEISKNIGNNAAGIFANCDLTISGGKITENSGTGNGPGVYMSAAKLTMTGGQISYNVAGGNGGGVYLAQATMEMTGGEISGNRGGMGGGIYNYGSSLTIKDGLIQNNAGYKLGGGGVYSNNRFESDNTTVKAEASLVIEGGTFSGNTSKTDGAGIRADSGKFKMTGGLVTGNTAEGASGGMSLMNIQNCEISGGTVTKNKGGNAAGVYFTKGTLTISGGEFSYNEGTGSGAGMMITSSEAKFSGGVIKNNTAKGDGAGLYVSNATLTLCGGKIQNNTAKKMCGGLLAAKDSKIYFTSGTISGNSAKASSGGMLIQTGSTLRMSGGTVSGNKTEKHGGGIYINKQSSGTISGGVISGNTTEKSGAGVYVGVEGYLAMVGGKITGNTATTQGGGLVAVGKVDMTGGLITKNEAKLYGGGVYVTETTMTFSGGTVEDNRCVDGAGFCVRGEGGVLKMSDDAKVLNNKCEKSGGGILVQAKGKLFIDGGEICGNHAPNGGGGIRMHQCPAEIKNAKINNNTSNGQGAGIYSNLSLILKDSEVCDNKVIADPNVNQTRSSGAIRAHNESILEMENVKVTGNSCDGRAGAMEVAYNVDATVKNCTFADNTATEQGGTFYIYWEGQAYLYDCTIDGGSAPKGGVVSMDAYGEIEFHDCLISENQADEGGVAYQNVRARAVFDGCTIKNNVAKKNASVIWANGDVVLKDTLVTDNKDRSGSSAIYLTNVNGDTESYIPGVYEVMGNTIVQGNEGGDMVLTDNAFLNVHGDGLGADAKIQVKLQDQDITRWVIGPYNYEVSGDGFLLTRGERSLSELFMGSGESAPVDETQPEQIGEEQNEEQTGKSNLALILGIGAIVVVLVLAVAMIAILRKKKR